MALTVGPRVRLACHWLGRPVSRAAICGLALILLGSGGLSDERLIRNFDLVVFRSEYRQGVEDHLRKWVVPIRIYLDTRAGDAALHKRLVERHVRHLAMITGHDIRIVDELRAANIVAVFERESKLAEVVQELFPAADNLTKIFRTSVCLGSFDTNRRFEIIKAFVIIPPDRAASRGKLPACIVEEFTQVLGLPNDSAEVYPSIFNDRSVDDELTEQDVILIRLLYDPRLRPGMRREDVLRLARRILPEMRR